MTKQPVYVDNSPQSSNIQTQDEQFEAVVLTVIVPIDNIDVLQPNAEAITTLLKEKCDAVIKK